VTGFEPQCVFKPKLGVAGKQNWELPKSQSCELPKSQSWELCVDLIDQVDETMVLFWHGVYA
jgi:hypothetical protein